MAFVLARSTGFAITFYQVQKLIGRIHLVPLRQGASRIRPAVAYALDAGFQMAFGQVDGVVLNHTIGPAAVGLYQAGLKLFMGGAQGIQILANVFFCRALRRAATTRRNLRRKPNASSTPLSALARCSGWR